MGGFDCAACQVVRLSDAAVSMVGIQTNHKVDRPV